MSRNKVTPVNVTILGKEFQVASPESEHQKLLQAASFLDKRMKEIRETGKVLGLERIAVMAALNLSYELLNMPDIDQDQAKAIGKRVDQLSHKIEKVLQESEQLELTNNS